MNLILVYSSIEMTLSKVHATHIIYISILIWIFGFEETDIGIWTGFGSEILIIQESFYPHFVYFVNHYFNRGYYHFDRVFQPILTGQQVQMQPKCANFDPKLTFFSENIGIFSRNRPYLSWTVLYCLGVSRDDILSIVLW